MTLTPLVPKSGIHYFFAGLHLIKQKGLRTFVMVPLLINLLLFSGMIYLAIDQLQVFFNWLQTQLPEFLSWLNILLWPLAVLILLSALAFIFSSVMNWISAPFNGLLAEKVEQLLTGQSLNTGSGLDIIKDLPRILSREWIKLTYYLPRALGFLLLFLLPVIGQTIAPIIWFLFSAWMMSIQYCDYAFDNHKVSFQDMRVALNQTKGSSMGFGATVALFSLIPIVNFIVMPVAICGATAMWVDQYRDTYRNPLVTPNRPE